MDYEWCRINELVRHAERGDVQAQALLLEEIRGYLRDQVAFHGDARRTDDDFPARLLARARTDFGVFWSHDAEFGTWMDGILQREAREACGHS